MIDTLQQVTKGFLRESSLASHLLLLLMISIFFNLFYFHKSTITNKKRNININKDYIVKNFLEGQAVKTKNCNQYTSRQFVEKPVVRFRSAYLAIESKGLEKGVDSEDYWKYINKKISKLLDILGDNKSRTLLKKISDKINLIKIELQKTPNNEAKTATLKSLDKLYLSCIDNQENPDKLTHFSDKLSDLYNRLRDSHSKYVANMSHSTNQYLNTSNTTIDKISGSIKNISNSHKRLKRLPRFMDLDALESIQTGNAKLEKGVNSLREDISHAKTNLESISTKILTSNTLEKSKSISDELSDISDEILAANDREISRLKDVIKDQKGTIKDLQHSLIEIEGTTNESVSNTLVVDDTELKTNVDTEIDLLKNNLREAEHCITILEGELDSLKLQKNTHLEILKDEDAAPVSEAELESLNTSINTLQNEISLQSNVIKKSKTILDFFLESSGAETIEDLSVLIYQCCNDLDINPQILIKSQSRVLELCSSGSIPEREKRLIDSLQHREISSSSTGNKLYFKNKSISGLVENSNLVPISQEEKVEYIKLFNAVDKQIQNINQSQNQWKRKRSLNEISNSVKVLANDIDITIDDLLSSSESSIKDGFSQLQNIGRSVGLKANQVAVIKRIEKNALSDLGGDSRVKLRLRKAALGILKKIEAAED